MLRSNFGFQKVLTFDFAIDFLKVTLSYAYAYVYMRLKCIRIFVERYGGAFEHALHRVPYPIRVL